MKTTENFIKTCKEFEKSWIRFQKRHTAFIGGTNTEEQGNLFEKYIEELDKLSEKDRIETLDYGIQFAQKNISNGNYETSDRLIDDFMNDFNLFDEAIPNGDNKWINKSIISNNINPLSGGKTENELNNAYKNWWEFQFEKHQLIRHYYTGKKWDLEVESGDNVSLGNNNNNSSSIAWMKPLLKEITELEFPTHEEVFNIFKAKYKGFEYEFDFNSNLTSKFAKGGKLIKKSISVALIAIHNSYYPENKIKEYTTITKHFQDLDW